ncbi:MAG: pyridoxamine 5'-phosphate oxidase family protein, partial [Prevotellaceae bacterium]|nr:pyridoxamine 5'-phosphate oxidase family protein [Prevotellaceae bacterium]
FIKKHHVLTLATFDGNGIYCSNVFYAYDMENNAFVFYSDSKTKHFNDMKINKNVAASIVLETKIVGKIQGLQINGIAEQPSDETQKRCHKIYVKRFPYAIINKSDLWMLEMTFAKYTNNILGFGKKIIWEKSK